MKQVQYFTIAHRKELLIVYKDGSSAVIDLCAIFGLEMVEEEDDDKN